jgi:hypothetical protein
MAELDFTTHLYKSTKRDYIGHVNESELTERFNNFDPIAERRRHCVYDDRNILLNTFFPLARNHINFV